MEFFIQIKPELAQKRMNMIAQHNKKGVHLSGGMIRHNEQEVGSYVFCPSGLTVSINNLWLISDALLEAKIRRLFS